MVILLAFFLFGCEQNREAAGQLEKLETVIRLHSNFLDENRSCLVQLPESYFEKGKQNTYPILILLDGSTHFQLTSATIDSLSTGSGSVIPEMIVIAIENVDRERDFTVTKIKTKRPNTMGGGRRFLDFIERELIPYVDKHYRTQPYRVLAGHSLGGLLAVNAYMDANRIFDGYIAMDPSIWWDEVMMQEKVAAVAPEAFLRKLYIASANQGKAKYTRNALRHERLYALMKERSPLSGKLGWEYFEDENHRSVPGGAMKSGLKFLFPENAPEYLIIK